MPFCFPIKLVLFLFPYSTGLFFVGLFCWSIFGVGVKCGCWVVEAPFSLHSTLSNNINPSTWSFFVCNCCCDCLVLSQVLLGCWVVVVSSAGGWLEQAGDTATVWLLMWSFFVCYCYWCCCCCCLVLAFSGDVGLLLWGGGWSRLTLVALAPASTTLEGSRASCRQH